MSDIEDIVQKGQDTWNSLKKVFSLLKERKFFAAFKESFSFLKFFYKEYMKGQYFVIAGKRISRTLAAVLAVVLYIIWPSGNSKTDNNQTTEIAETKNDTNTYDKNGLKVYNLRKCESENGAGACGILENYGNNNFAFIKIDLTFFRADGTAVYKGGVEATNMEAHTSTEITIPCSEEFAYFKLESVSTEGTTAQ